MGPAENGAKFGFRAVIAEFWQAIRKTLRIARRHPLVVFPFFVSSIISCIVAVITKISDMNAYGWPKDLWGWGVLAWMASVILISLYTVYGWSVRALRGRVLRPTLQCFAGIFVVCAATYTAYLAWNHYKDLLGHLAFPGAPAMYTVIALGAVGFGIRLIIRALRDPTLTPRDLKLRDEREREEMARARAIEESRTDAQREHDFDVLMTKVNRKLM